MDRSSGIHIRDSYQAVSKEVGRNKLILFDEIVSLVEIFREELQKLPQIGQIDSKKKQR